jgi:hypothetical protein
MPSAVADHQPTSRIATARILPIRGTLDIVVTESE